MYGIIGFIHDITYSNTNKCLQVVKKFWSYSIGQQLMVKRACLAPEQKVVGKILQGQLTHKN